MLRGLAGREVSEIISISPIMTRPNGSRAKSAAAVRAHIPKDRFHAMPAECAFKRANHRDACLRGKRRLTVFAVRAEFEHRNLRKNLGRYFRAPQEVRF